TRVVVRGKHESIGSGGPDGQQVSWLEARQFAVTRKEIAGFADRADYIDGHGLATGGLLHGDDLVMRFVERGPDEIVHRGMDNDEGLGAIPLNEEHACQKNTGFGDNGA